MKSDNSRLLLAGIAVNWHCDTEVFDLLKSWPVTPRFELIVVDNSDSLGSDLPGARVLRPSHNLGFGGAVNAALDASQAPLILILNPDAHPLPGALESLIEGFERHPGTAGLAPRLVSADGASQHRWQLRKVPNLATLLLQTLMIPAGQGSLSEPHAESAVEQPAAAALAFRRTALDSVGGFDDRFYPAWFEDVDLARRLQDRGLKILYWPDSTFEHQLGTTVRKLGYGRFLWIYYRNLTRYLEKHHSRFSATAARLLLALAATIRIPLLAFRKPQRAASRGVAIAGLGALILGAVSRWRLPRTFDLEHSADSSTKTAAD